MGFMRVQIYEKYLVLFSVLFFIGILYKYCKICFIERVFKIELFKNKVLQIRFHDDLII